MPMLTADPHSPHGVASASGARWRAVAQRAQAEFAAALGRAVSSGQLDRDRYRHWLALESALSCTSALALERLAAWHEGSPALRATARAWAHDLREDAMAATTDLRMLGSVAPPPLPLALAHWHTYVAAACGSPRAGEALGAVLVHDALANGATPPISAGVIGLRGLHPCSHAWLRRRLRPRAHTLARERGELCAAWSASALATGARRGWEWYRAALHAATGFVDA